MRNYDTREDAVQAEIVDRIEIDEAGDRTHDARALFDVDAISAAVIEQHGDSFVCVVDGLEFWDVVVDHAR